MRYKKNRKKELALAAAFLLGLIAAEMPQNVKNYTQTSAKYSLENYGNGLATRQSDAIGLTDSNS